MRIVDGAPVVEHRDADGRHFLVRLPNGYTDPEKGHIIGPPLFDEVSLPLEIDADQFRIKLGNELFSRGIYTESDAKANLKAVEEAKRAALANAIPLAAVLKAFAASTDSI